MYMLGLTLIVLLVLKMKDLKTFSRCILDVKICQVVILLDFIA
jgi:hypothetical protein